MKAAQIVVLMHGTEAAQLRRDRKGLWVPKTVSYLVRRHFGTR